MLSRGAAEAATAEAAKALREGLRALSATAAAHVDAANSLERKAKEYAIVLDREHARIEEERADVEELKRKLEADRAALEKERSHQSAGDATVAAPVAHSRTQLDRRVLSKPVQDASTLVVPKDASTLVVPKESGVRMLRPPSPVPPPGDRPAEKLGERLAEKPVERPAEKPAERLLERSAEKVPRRPAATSGSMMAAGHFGGRELGRGSSSSLEYSVTVGDYCYSVLPPRAMSESRPGHDMVGQVVTVPEQWEVLSTSADGFDFIIGSLTSKGWGTLRLCVKDADTRAGFSSFCTSLRPFGVPGERLMHDKHVLEQAGADDDMRYKFTDDLVSGRLVIRRRAAGKGAEGPAAVGGQAL